MHEERDRWDVDSSSRPGVTYKVEKETHEKQIETSMCRLCGEKEETTFHILCGCSKIAATTYKKRHDGVASIVH